MGTVYGSSSVLDTTRDYLNTQCTNLMVAMSGSTTPNFSAVYNKHNTVIKAFNAITIDLENYEAIPSGLDDGVITSYQTVWSLRIHTDFIGGVTDGQKATRLMDSVKNYLSARKVIEQSTSHRIDTVNGGNNNEEFAQSYTFGNEMFVTVTKIESHTQA